MSSIKFNGGEFRTYTLLDTLVFFFISRWAESSESLPREHVERRVEELRAMERWVAGEAGTLRGLKQERETLSGPALQQDLSRVHAMLAINSKVISMLE